MLKITGRTSKSTCFKNFDELKSFVSFELYLPGSDVLTINVPLEANKIKYRPLKKKHAQAELDIVRNEKKKKMAENRAKTMTDYDPTKKRKGVVVPTTTTTSNDEQQQQHVQAIGLSTSDGFYVVSKKVIESFEAL